jgi:hypothetical protein
MYPNWDFWFENKPSGNPGCDTFVTQHVQRALAILGRRDVQCRRFRRKHPCFISKSLL